MSKVTEEAVVQTDKTAFSVTLKPAPENFESLTSEELINHIYGSLYSLPFRVKTENPGKVYRELEFVLTLLQKYREKCSTEEEIDLKTTFLQMIHKLAMMSPSNKHFYEKPFGYAGDFKAMEMIWRGRKNPSAQFEGDTLLGQHINAFTLNMANCIANEYRVNRLSEIVSKKEYKAIASIGCGSIIEIEEAAKQGKMTGKKIHLFDMDKDAIKVAKGKAEQYNLDCECHGGNVFKSFLRLKGQKFDLIYSSGLFDYLDMTSSKKLAGHLWNKVNPGGQLLITNANASNPTRFWMECVTDWTMIYKDKKEMKSLTSDFQDVKSVSVAFDGLVYQYLTATKGL